MYSLLYQTLPRFLSFRHLHHTPMAFEGNTWLTYLIFSLIAIIAFLGNSLVLYVFVTRRSYLKHPYNIFIFNLALTDILTAIFLLFSRFLYLPPTPEGTIAREIYCRTIWPSLILFNMLYISLYTAVGLTIERWLAVVKPMVYRCMKPHHAIKAILSIWIFGSAVNLSTVFRAKFDENKKRCVWITLEVANDELSWLDFTLQAVIPFSTIIILYIHILVVMRRLAKTSPARYQRRTTVVALATTTAMMVAAIPSRTSFLLSKVSTSLDANGLLHFCFVTLALSNSCVNPFLYGMCVSQFRKDYKVIFQKFFGRCRRRSPDLRRSSRREERMKISTL